MQFDPYMDRDTPLHRERSEAFAYVLRAVTAGRNTVVIDRGENRRTMDHADSILRALELDGIATVQREAGQRTITVLVTMAGRRLAVERDAGGLPLFPQNGALRIVEPPPEWPRGVDLATQAGRGRLRAMAPDYYDADTRQGSAVTVILDPLVDWSTHPTYLARRHGAGEALRAWEVFTCDGESHGLLLMRPDGFDGVEPDGSVSPDRSPNAAAWEIVMNS